MKSWMRTSHRLSLNVEDMTCIYGTMSESPHSILALRNADISRRWARTIMLSSPPTLWHIPFQRHDSTGERRLLPRPVPTDSLCTIRSSSTSPNIVRGRSTLALPRSERLTQCSWPRAVGNPLHPCSAYAFAG
jgi:hypothetical protein